MARNQTCGLPHPPRLQQERYKEIADEMKHMLVRVGWKGDFVEKSVPIIPISGWMGDNLITKSTNMSWWTGVDVTNMINKKIHVHTLLDALNDFAEVGFAPRSFAAAGSLLGRVVASFVGSSGPAARDRQGRTPRQLLVEWPPSTPLYNPLKPHKAISLELGWAGWRANGELQCRGPRTEPLQFLPAGA